MEDNIDVHSDAFRLACLWCESKGEGWSVRNQLGKGGTAPVFEIATPNGVRALKIYDAEFSSGELGEIEQKRIDQQLALRGHNCPYLVQVYEGGLFRDRLFLLMSRAPGKELEKSLKEIPRGRIRDILDQVAQAALFLDGKGLCHRDIKAANVFVSDDFKQTTLLDVSVIRDIHDPVGLGTDHGGQLPVLATARYSPPEYLFRLLEPGPKLWHALTIYQLGALLHDLIMRAPLFEAEYLKSKENRYRFAWIVATAIPQVEAHDVDQDLIMLARRSLDKDWERRSTLRLQDFFADSNVQQEHALQLLGVGRNTEVVPHGANTAARLQQVRETASSLEESFREYLRKNGITATHEVRHGDHDNSKLIVFCWEVQTTGVDATTQKVELQLYLQLLFRAEGVFFSLSCKLLTRIGEAKRDVAIALPELNDESALSNYAESAFAKLAVEITRVTPE